MPNKNLRSSNGFQYIVHEELFLTKSNPEDDSGSTCSSETTTLGTLKSSSCTLSEKYNSIMNILKITIDPGLNVGIFGEDYLKTLCYDVDATKTIYDCLAGLRYHFSDAREIPDQNNPWTLVRPFYYLTSMAQYDPADGTTVIDYLSPAGATAWQDFLDALEADLLATPPTFSKDDIAILIGASLPHTLYDPPCKMKQYFDKYISDTDVSYGVKAEMAKMSLIVNSYFLDKDTANDLITNYDEYTTSADKNTLLKLVLTLGTSLQSKPWLEDLSADQNRADMEDIITSLEGSPTPDASLVTDIKSLLLDFTFLDDPQVTINYLEL